jgi:hypothetical protein
MGRDLAMWTPSTLEDHLLQEYFSEYPGTAFLELPVSLLNDPSRARRIDAVLVPDAPSEVHPPSEYDIDKVREAIHGKSIHVIEAKYALNRGVIGQVLVAKHLIERVMEPTEVVMDVVYVEDNADLKEFCEVQGINTHPYPHVRREHSPNEPARGKDGSRIEMRNPPDEARYRAFLTGWTHAVNGRLYRSIRKRKTHANMGNLFGWIYGEQPETFKQETWERYIEHSRLADTRR